MLTVPCNHGKRNHEVELVQLGAFNLLNRLVFNVNQGEPLVRANFTAINKLYKEQAYIQKMNSHPPPDTKKQSRFRKALLNSQKQSMIDYHLDRGVNTVMDGYCTQKKLSELCSIGMKDGTIVSMRNRVLGRVWFRAIMENYTIFFKMA
jgi:hypothetical protein